MKASTAATRTILSGGQFMVIECYELFIPSSATTYYFTSSDAPVTVGGHTYTTGLVISRGSYKQKAGLDPQTLDMTMSPQTDSPYAPVTIGGFGFLEACRNGTMDSARLAAYKLFATTVGDWSAGLTPWFNGRANQINVGRQKAQIAFVSDLAVLNVAMPRNVLQTGCGHTLYDAGCTLNRASFTFTGSVQFTAGDRSTLLTTGTAAGKPNGYFDLGRLTMTSGALAGISRTVKAFVNASGRFTFLYPMPRTASPGDTFSVSAGCDKLRSTCVAKFNNELHFRGYPFVPQPETLYQGGANVPYQRVEPGNVPGSQQGYHIPGIYRG